MRAEGGFTQTGDSAPGATCVAAESGQRGGALPESGRVTVKTEQSVRGAALGSAKMMRQRCAPRKAAIASVRGLRQNLPKCQRLARILADHASSSLSSQVLKSIGVASGPNTEGNAASARLTSIFSSAS